MGRYTIPMKLALSFFLLFMLLGLASSIALYHQQFGFDSELAGDYYRGNVDDPDAKVMLVEKSYRQLLEVTHFHLYIMPIVYLALVHLYFLSAQPQWEKILMTVGTFLGLLLEISAPWIVRYASGGWSRLFWGSGLLITIPTVWMCLICFLELWWRPGAGETS